MTQTRSLLLLLSFVAVFLGCSQRAKEGVYIGQEGSYLELKADGSFYAKNIELKSDRFEAEDSPRRAISTAGKYSWEEGGVTFVFEGGRAIRARTVGDTILVGTSSDERWVFWRGGKSGFVYEQKLSEVQSKTSEFWRLVAEEKMSEQEATNQSLDLLVKEGFVSPEQAQKEREERRRRIQSHKDAIINDLNNLAANAYQYRIRPKSMGGGGGSYLGYTIPQMLVQNENAIYRASATSDTVVFTASSRWAASTVNATLDQSGRLAGWAYTGQFK